MIRRVTGREKGVLEQGALGFPVRGRLRSIDHYQPDYYVVYYDVELLQRWLLAVPLVQTRLGVIVTRWDREFNRLR